MNLREIIEDFKGDKEQFKSLLTAFDGPFPMFCTLSPAEQDDVLDGNCIYRQHEHHVILDYTQKWWREANKPEGAST